MFVGMIILVILIAVLIAVLVACCDHDENGSWFWQRWSDGKETEPAVNLVVNSVQGFPEEWELIANHLTFLRNFTLEATLYDNGALAIGGVDIAVTLSQKSALKNAYDNHQQSIQSVRQTKAMAELAERAMNHYKTKVK